MSVELLRSIHNSQDNSQCFECNRKKSSWACTELCVFLCIDCAHKVKSECSEIFLIKSLSMATWSAEEIEKLSNGGNLRLRSLLGQYRVYSEQSLPHEYCNRAVEYYKQLLKAELYNYPPPQPPTLEEGPIYLYQDKLTWWQRAKESFKSFSGRSVPVNEPNSNTEQYRPFNALCGLRELSFSYASSAFNNLSESFQPSYIQMEDSSYSRSTSN